MGRAKAARVRVPLAMRFARKFDVDPSGCWLWTGAIFPEGYGAISVGRRAMKAHRVSYQLMKGAIPKRRNYVDHACDVRRCVNPAHLRPTTNKQNCVRAQSPLMNAYRNGTCVRGHKVRGKNAYHVKGRSNPLCRECTLRQQKEWRGRKRA